MDGFMDTLLGKDGDKKQERFGLAPGIVTSNVELMAEGKVLVRIPAMPGFETWARVASVGGGAGRGFVWMPQVDDEVLVGFAQNDPADAYVLGGLWSTRDRPPLNSLAELLSKRVIKTGVAGAPMAHEVEFDDVKQSITITTSTMQKLTLKPEKIELSGASGALTVTLDTASQSISIQGPEIKLKALKISLEAGQLDLKGSASVNISATGACVVTGQPIKLN